MYCDPPYLLHTRSGERRYRYEYTEQDHRSLLALLKTLPCAVILSGYPSRLYDERLAAWRTLELQVMNHAGVRTEKLWLNFPHCQHRCRLPLRSCGLAAGGLSAGCDGFGSVSVLASARQERRVAPPKLLPGAGQASRRSPAGRGKLLDGCPAPGILLGGVTWRGPSRGGHAPEAPRRSA